MAERYAPHGFCPVFNCGTPLPSANAVFCADHYFCAPNDKVRATMRMKIKAARETDLDRRTRFASQAIIQERAIVRDIQHVREPR